MESPPHDSIRIGGLMRCCIETIGDLYPNGPCQFATEGQTLQCKYSNSANHRVIFRDGAWEWDREAAGLTAAAAKLPELPDTTNA